MTSKIGPREAALRAMREQPAPHRAKSPAPKDILRQAERPKERPAPKRKAKR